MHYAHEEQGHFCFARTDIEYKTLSMPKSSRVEGKGGWNQMTGCSVSPWRSEHIIKHKTSSQIHQTTR